ncbi:Aldose 1-epimerase precursor [Bacteroidales bacterium Barb6XT]|nr:Aldose 1-epimerase precursor [Bacteroidales bacterium Barb6XT]
MKKICLTAVVLCVLVACGEKKGEQEETATLSGLLKSDFDAEANSKQTALYVLTNRNGAEACITNYGGRLVSLMVPDRDGKLTDVVLGYDNIGDYLASNGNYGALIGRFGNRIAQGKFTLDGQEYQLPQNNNGHCLHGGADGYHVQLWEANQTDAQTLELHYLSPDGEAGFPGNLDVRVLYELTDDNALSISYEATTDKPTVVNLTNHSYFNLSGKAGTDVLDHLVSINADTYTAVDEYLIPTGEFSSVESSPMDLRQPVAVGEHIGDSFEQLVWGKGYDHNWVLNAQGDMNVLAARVVSPVSGIVLEVYTNEPGIQFYASNAMSGHDKGKFGTVYPVRGGLCLETQHYPDSPNRNDFPSTVLRPGETYRSQCIYKLTVEE